MNDKIQSNIMKEERTACGTHRVFMEFREGKESQPGGDKI